MTIPDYDDADYRVTQGLGDPLDKFIVDNEPAGAEHERRFREGLQAVVDYLLEKH